MYKNYVKRLLDIICSVIGILLFWWVYLIVSILVRFNLGSPIFFSQNRLGKDGKLFKLYKFRTMTEKKDKSGSLLPDDERLTKFGRLLRASSMDEIPEVLNILKGDMSLVGPRPLLTEYFPYYTEKEMHRHDLRPGLTGWAQVNGRNATDWDERLRQDVEYVEKCSFLFDCKIILLTVLKVLKRSDVLVGKQITVGRLDVVRKKKE